LAQSPLDHRAWVPAMVPWRATEDGFVTQDNLDWYRRFAIGRPAALVVEATGISRHPERAAAAHRSRSISAGLKNN